MKGLSGDYDPLKPVEQILLLERLLEERTRELCREKERLRLTYEYLENILRTRMIGIVATDRSGVITFVNESAVEMLNHPREEILGQLLSEQLPPGTLGKDLEESNIGIIDGFQDELVFPREQENSLVAHVSLSVLRDNSGLEQGILCLLNNISQRKQLERKLQNTQKLEAVGQLAAGVAHEINTPVQYIRDNLAFIRTEFATLCEALEACTSFVRGDASQNGVEAVRSTLAKVELDYLLKEIPLALAQSLEGAESVAQIVRSLKLFSHPGCTEKHLVDVHAALESVVIVSRNEWKYVADVRMSLAANLSGVMGYQSELNQALLNLVVNAAHAIEERKEREPEHVGIINLRTFEDDTSYLIEVQDNGSGIPDAVMPRIFDPFFTTKPIGKGTGQGLSFVHHTIVKRHSGSIDVDSTPGVGTTFSIRLPKEK